MSKETPEIREDVVKLLLRLDIDPDRESSGEVDVLAHFATATIDGGRALTPEERKTVFSATAVELAAVIKIHEKVGEATAEQAKLWRQLRKLLKESGDGNGTVDELPPKERAKALLLVQHINELEDLVSQFSEPA